LNSISTNLKTLVFSPLTSTYYITFVQNKNYYITGRDFIVSHIMSRDKNNKYLNYIKNESKQKNVQKLKLKINMMEEINIIFKPLIKKN